MVDKNNNEIKFTETAMFVNNERVKDYAKKINPDQRSVNVDQRVMLNFADDEKTILKSLVMLQILRVQQSIDEDIFSLSDEGNLQVQLMLLKNILSKISA